MLDWNNVRGFTGWNLRDWYALVHQKEAFRRLKLKTRVLLLTTPSGKREELGQLREKWGSQNINQGIFHDHGISAVTLIHLCSTFGQGFFTQTSKGMGHVDLGGKFLEFLPKVPSFNRGRLKFPERLGKKTPTNILLTRKVFNRGSVPHKLGCPKQTP